MNFNKLRFTLIAFEKIERKWKMYVLTISENIKFTVYNNTNSKMNWIPKYLIFFSYLETYHHGQLLRKLNIEWPTK